MTCVLNSVPNIMLFEICDLYSKPVTVQLFNRVVQSYSLTE